MPRPGHAGPNERTLEVTCYKVLSAAVCSGLVSRVHTSARHVLESRSKTKRSNRVQSQSLFTCYPKEHSHGNYNTYFVRKRTTIIYYSFPVAEAL
jgi:hypothetical protein